MTATNGYAVAIDGAAFTPDGRVDVRPETVAQRNRRLSREEVASFKRDAPGPLFAYVTISRLPGRQVEPKLRAGDKITTWMGDKLAIVTRAGEPYRSNLGDERQSVRALGINGAVYYGTAYLSSGDCVRLRPMKKQSERRR